MRPLRRNIVVSGVASLLAGLLLAGRAGAQSAAFQYSARLDCLTTQEVSFTLPEPAANPYDPEDVDVWGEVRAPGGRVARVPAFYMTPYDPVRHAPAGAPGWRWRFTPEEPGDYTVRMTVSRRGGAASVIGAAAFTAHASLRKGFVRAEGRRFRLTTGEVVLALGANRCWGDVRDVESYLKDLHTLAANGARVVRVWLAPWWMPIERERGRYDPAAAALLDVILAEAVRLDLKVILCIEQHGNLEPEGGEVGRWKEHPYHEANGGPCATVRQFFTKSEARRLFRNRLRYLVARYAHYTALMAWELFNEVEWVPLEQGGLNAQRWVVEDWHRDMAACLRACDAYRHLVATSSDVELQAGLLRDGTIDFLQLHVYTEAEIGQRVQEEVERALGRTPAPVVVAEFGLRPGDAAPDTVTEGVFAALASGAAGALPWLQEQRDVTPSAMRIQAARGFFDALEVRSEAYSPSGAVGVLSNRPLDARAGEVASHATAALAFRIPPPARAPSAILRIDGLREGIYDVEYWNPAEGVALHRTTLRADGGVLSAPWGEARAVRLVWRRAFGE